MPTIEQKIAQEEARLKSKLGNFSVEVTEDQRNKCTGSHRYSISDTTNYEKRRLIVFTLEHLLGCKFAWFPMEKIHWWVDFSYGGVFCSIAHQKFGFFLYITEELGEEEANELSQKLVDELDAILEDLKPVTSLYAKQAVKSGKIILNNKLQDLEDRYVHYRDASFKVWEGKFEIDDLVGESSNDISELGTKEHDTAKKSDNSAEIQDRFSDYRRNSKLHLYNQEVAVIYFISLIEHLCLLLYAFKFNGISVVDLAMKNWGDKFELVIGISDPEINEGYEYLKKVSLYKRNPVAHGFLTPKMTEADFYFQQARQRTAINLFNGELLSDYSYNVDLSKLDKLLTDIRKSAEFHNAMKYLDNSEFDISYDPGSIAEYEALNEMTEEKLDEYIEATSWRIMNGWNMDW